MKVVFRADASRELGAGHIMRCLTLADGLRANGAACRFLSDGLPSSLAQLLRSRGHVLEEIDAATPASDAEASARALAREPPDWLVADHYGIGQDWESDMRAHARRILAIDDLDDRDHDCDLLLDQNYYTGFESRYSRHAPVHARRLLGPRFALVREEFRAARAHVHARDGVVRRLLIFFGGMDAADCTSAALQALAQLPRRDFAVDVVIGAEHANRERISATCEQRGYSLHIQTTRMAELMSAADLALGAGGSASWERCSVGLPALLVAVADNQRALVRDSELAGFAYAPLAVEFDAQFFARHLELLLAEPERLRRMSQRGLELVDGQGMRRVLRAMGIGPVRIRPATPSDSRAMFEWRNHPDIRRVSRNDAVIEWRTHEAWFSGVLADPRRVLLVGEADGRAAGVVRFDLEGDSADVSIYKVPGLAIPNQAAGADLLAAAEYWLTVQEPQIRRLTATVLPDNEPSRRLFDAAGYIFDGTRFSKRISP